MPLDQQQQQAALAFLNTRLFQKACSECNAVGNFGLDFRDGWVFRRSLPLCGFDFLVQRFYHVSLKLTRFLFGTHQGYCCRAAQAREKQSTIDFNLGEPPLAKECSGWVSSVKLMHESRDFEITFAMFPLLRLCS